MFKPYYLITKLNLMKKTVLGVKALAFSVVFFFLGMVSVNAQYVSSNEAIQILKAEVQNLEAQIPNATLEERVNLDFRISYYKFIVWDIQDGTEVEVAIQNNKPTDKLKLNQNGLVSRDNNMTSVKQEINTMVSYVDNLLTD